jgi:predicted RND superfamily exporter protein
MIIGHFFPGEVAPGEVSWAVWASIGVGMAHVVSLFSFFCVLIRQDKKKRIMDDKRAEYLKFHHTSVSKGSLDL